MTTRTVIDARPGFWLSGNTHAITPSPTLDAASTLDSTPTLDATAWWDDAGLGGGFALLPSSWSASPPASHADPAASWPPAPPADAASVPAIASAQPAPAAHRQAASADTVAPNDAADASIGGPAARSTYAVTGAGIKIGIISDSFNDRGGYASDVQNGWLPANVTVLQDQAAGGTDEGRAMAELVYETAPGAQIYFHTSGNDVASFAAAVQSLQAAGCTVIVDDISVLEPFFQEGNALDNAITSFIGAGGDYFTSSANDGNAYYQSTFAPAAGATLPGIAGSYTLDNFGSTEAAISGSATLQKLTIAPGTHVSLQLQWNQPFPGIGGSAGAANTMNLYLYQNGQLVASASGAQPDGTPYQTLDYTAPANAASSTYDLAISWSNDGPQPGTFRYFIADDVATINDPAAGAAPGTYGDLYGHAMVPGVNAVGATDISTYPAGQEPSIQNVPTVDAYSEYGTGEVLFDNNGNPLPAPQAQPGVAFVGPDGSQMSVPGFMPFDGTSSAAPVAAAVATLMLQDAATHGVTLTPAQVTADLAASAIPMTSTSPAAQVGAGFIQAPAALATETSNFPCFARGTLIRTARGDVPVEALRVGDAVIGLLAGGAVPVCWIGRRAIDLARHARRERVQPIRIRAHAFAPGLPARDLLLSPDHAVFVDGRLIAARLLRNDATILSADELRHVEYFHVELPCHDVLLAEGLPAESFLDTGHRDAFSDTAPARRLHADLACADADRVRLSCAPFATQATEIAPVWQRLAARARSLGHVVPAAPAPAPADLRLAAGDRMLRPISAGPGHAVFALPRGARSVRLLSRAARPSDAAPWLDDRRRLGVQLGRITLRDGGAGHDLPLDHPALGGGWWPAERAAGQMRRWTDGDAAIALPAAGVLLDLRLTALPPAGAAAVCHMAARGYMVG